MRILQINGVTMDIDDQTAIGVDLQSYDIKSIGDNFVKVTNSFSIPATVKNLAVFGLPNNPQSLSNLVYEVATCDYWVGQYKIIDQGKVSVQEIEERISLFAFEKMSIWDVLKTQYFSEVLPDLITWLKDNKGLYTASNPFLGSFSTFIELYKNSTEGVILPMTWGNLAERKVANGLGGQVPIERLSGANYSMYLKIKYTDTYENNKVIDSYGGHFCIFAKTIFEFIEDTYGVNFLTAGGQLPGNIWDDPIANSVYIEAKELAINVSLGAPFSIYFHYTKDIPSTAYEFEPYPDAKDKADKTLYDFVVSFMQIFNIIKDEKELNGEKVIRLARWDDLKTKANIKEFSGLTGVPKYKPFVDGYAQTNYIKFKEIYETGDSLINSKVIALNNKNVDQVKTLFDIDAHVPAVVTNGPDAILDLSKSGAFKTFTFMVSNGLCATDTQVIYYEEGVILTAIYIGKLQKAQLYSLDSEYTFINEAFERPIWYEVKKWLTPPQVNNFEFFQQYYIRELNGAFFVNKIKGYNPEMSKEPVSLEIFKISDRTPVTPPDLDYWTDGVQDGFVDAINDYWY